MEITAATIYLLCMIVFGVFIQFTRAYSIFYFLEVLVSMGGTLYYVIFLGAIGQNVVVVVLSTLILFIVGVFTGKHLVEELQKPSTIQSDR